MLASPEQVRESLSGALYDACTVCPIDGNAPSSDRAIAVARLLLARGADVNVVSCAGGETSIAAAARWSVRLVAALLEEAGARDDNFSGIWAAVREGNAECVRLLLAHHRRPDGTFACPLPTLVAAAEEEPERGKAKWLSLTLTLLRVAIANHEASAR